VNRLLFIEDDDEIRLVIRLALEDEGYQVDEARDGRSGLAMFERHEPDLVLLDLRLPDMVGFDVCRTIRNRSIVPIVIVTAQMDTVDLVAGLEAGADDYVTKPVVIKELAARIRALLRRVQLQEAAPPKPVVFGDLEIRREQGMGGSTLWLLDYEREVVVRRQRLFQFAGLMADDDDGGPCSTARASAFAVLVFAELLRSFGARSETKSVWRISLFANVNLLIVVAISIGLQFLSQHNAMVGRLLKTTYMSFADCLWLLALGAIPLLVLELVKVVRSRACQKQPAQPPAIAPTASL
jgi:CheY-like chemotaxis protein